MVQLLLLLLQCCGGGGQVCCLGSLKRNHCCSCCSVAREEVVQHSHCLRIHCLRIAVVLPMLVLVQFLLLLERRRRLLLQALSLHLKGAGGVKEKEGVDQYFKMQMIDADDSCTNNVAIHSSKHHPLPLPPTSSANVY